MKQEKREKIKHAVYASTRYDNPQENGNFPNPATIDELIDVETKQFNAKIDELKERRAKLQDYYDMLMSLEKSEIAELSKREQQWLVHAIPKYKSIVNEINEEEDQ